MRNKIPLIALASFFLSSLASAQQLAFPGAEGFGRFTTGGRGGRVIEVTNLNDGGAGSLRAAVQASGARTIVFRVSGTIVLNSSLRIQNGNLTIAGQTAPGDGICLRDYDVSVDADNVIIRYLRFRLGDVRKLEADAFGGRGHRNIIIDHCSASWSVDECVSFYDNRNLTVQWCLISESLRNASHTKGPHGYGGIWGGYDCSFHHNLLAHHSSRNPRINGLSPAPADNADLRNNVIYNWGFNSAYGGEGGKVNMVANYYKYGPATGPKNRIVEPSDGTGQWYVAGNYVHGYPEVTADNWNGGVQGGYADRVRAYSPFPYAPVLTHSPEIAFALVPADAGATLPKRDSLDARIAMEALTGTATYGGAFTGPGTGIIDSQNDVGGWPTLNSAPAPADGDHDGMADEWELAHGLSPTNPDDRNGDFSSDGYTNLEKYLNSLTIRADFILPPAGLYVTTVSPSQLDLAWQENIFGETGFSIERSEGDTSRFVEVATVDANDTSFSDTGLSPHTTYYYRVRSFHNQARSIYTNYAHATTLHADGRALQANSPFPADGATAVTIATALSWIPGAAATSHDLYFGAANPPEFLGNQTATSFDPHGLLDSTVYFWRVDEVNAAGKTPGSIWSFVTESFMPDLVAHWPLDRGFGLLAQDATPYRNHAYLTNMVAANWVNGILGKALDFDGKDDYLRVNYSASIDFYVRGFSISLWVKPTGETFIAPWISKRSYAPGQTATGFELYHDANGMVRFVVADGLHESSVEAPDSAFVTGDWVLVTAVRDRTNNKLRLYANAVEQASDDDSTWNLADAREIFIGTNSGQQSFYRGLMDDLRLYNYALNVDEIRSLYEAATGVEGKVAPIEYRLELHNYPNPFNPITRIVYTVPHKSRVTLTVVNLLGGEVARLVDFEHKSAGEHSAFFEAGRFTSGVYFCRLRVGDEVLTGKMLLIQ